MNTRPPPSGRRLRSEPRTSEWLERRHEVLERSYRRLDALLAELGTDRPASERGRID